MCVVSATGPGVHIAVPVISPHKLHRAVRNSDQRLSPFRDRRKAYLQEYVGRYTYKDDRVKRPVNLVQRAIDVLIPHLATYNPEHDVTTDRLELRPSAAMLAMMLDRLGDEIDLVAISRMALLECCFSPAPVIKLGIRAGSDVVKINGRMRNLGQSYALPIDLDDFILDPACRNHEEKLFEGHYYRIPRDVALESGLFDAAVIERLPSIQDGRLPERDDPLEKFTQGDVSDQDRYDLVDLIELIDLAIYDDGITHIVTLPASEDHSGKYLRTEEWQGPERGPYEWLGFHPIPGQPFFRPLCATLMDQADAMNIVVGKLLNQLMRTKRVLLYKKAAGMDDATAIMQSTDGDVIGIDGEVEDVQDFDIGGTSADFAPAVQMLLGWSNLPLGNMDVLGGQPATRPGAAAGGRTATEFQGMLAQATVLIDDFQKSHERWHMRLANHFAWNLMSDPLLVKPMLARLAGGEMYQVEYDAATREGDHIDFNYKIHSRSMVYQDPTVKLRRVQEYIALVMQAAEAEMSTGGLISTAAVAKIGARLHDIPELDEIVMDPSILMEKQMLYQGVPTQGQPGQPQEVGLNQTRPPRAGVGPQTGLAESRSALSYGVPAA